MSETKSQEEARSPEEIRREIDETRDQLGETAAALAQKADVKARAQEKVDDLRQTVSSKKEAFAEKAHEASPQSAASAATHVSASVRSNPIPAAAVGAFVGGFLLGRITGGRD